MKFAREGYPLIFGSGVVTLVLNVLAGWWVGLVALALTIFVASFFRDPEREIPEGEGLVVSPADGRVMVAGAPTGEASPPGDWQQITIFLSPMDVHVNRMPVGGRVRKVRYHPGRFLPAYRADAGDLNEYTEVWLDHGAQTIVVRQVVGILARRIVCRVKEGDTVQGGQRFGVMKFGSRMDVFVPIGSIITVKVGDHVVGAVSVIAELRP